MTEEQANYDTDDPKPTPGPGEAEGRYVVAYPNDARPNGEIILGPTSRGNDLPGPEQRANAELSAAAFSAASELSDEYDAVMAVEVLPGLLEAALKAEKVLTSLQQRHLPSPEDVWDALSSLRQALAATHKDTQPNE